MKQIYLILGFLMVFSVVQSQNSYPASGSITDLLFEPLGFPYNAVESFADAKTMEVHYTKHHKGYFDKLMDGIKDKPYKSESLLELFKRTSEMPLWLRNMGGGHFNHSLFWKILSANSAKIPSNKLLVAINSDFESFENFKKLFEDAAKSHFGSGWVWLSVNTSGKLFISTTPNQDNPLMDVAELKGIPILGLDIWEHAYYLKYQNKRTDYISNFWNVVDWTMVETFYYEAVKLSNQQK